MTNRLDGYCDMRKISLVILGTLLTLCASAVNQPLQRILIDADWQFALNVLNPLVSSWNADTRMVNLPHDWSIEQHGDVGPFFKDGDYQMGFTKGGTGWYRKQLSFPRDIDEGGSAWIYFEGVYNQATVFINGAEVAKTHYGYFGFKIDVSKYAHQTNGQQSSVDLLVKVENKGNNTRWYAGSGIIRHVWLEYHNKGYIDPWDVQITTDAIFNNKAVVSFWLKGEKQFSREIKNPQLWSPENPYLYTMKVDGNEFQYGIRTIDYSAERGFLLNGTPILLKGGCVHHDGGLLGAASLDKAEDRKLQLMKDQGYNAVRCSHNLQSEHFMHACDSIGLMVIDECFDQWYDAKNSDDYHNYFTDHYKEDLSLMVRRDRNHPSVIMWSMGNEIPGRHTERSQKAADQMRRTILSIDNTRPVTAALCGWDNRSMDWKRDAPKAWRSLDIVGYNYMWREYEADHDSVPNLIMVGTESYAKEAAQNWQMVEKYPFVIGDFVWTAWDYLGEAGIGHSVFAKEGENVPFFMPWPYFNGWCGDIDLIGQKKPQSYFRDVVWGEKEIAMAVEEYIPEGTHNVVSGWGWPLEHNWWSGIQDSLRMVNVYSKAANVRLYLNGTLIDTKPTDSHYKASFSVPYTPGVLKAVTYVGKKEGESVELKSFDAPASLGVSIDRDRLHADAHDLAFVTISLLDAEGNLVPETGRKLTIEAVSSLGAQGAEIHVGNASPTDMESFQSTALNRSSVFTPALYEGRAQIIVRTSSKQEDLKIRISAEGMEKQELAIVVR